MITTFLLVSMIAVGTFGVHLIRRAQANNTAQTLPFSQNWTNTGQITANDNWSGVAGIEGYFIRNDGTTATGVDPQTLTGDTYLGAGAPELDVTANQTNPNAVAAPGGVLEFEQTLQAAPANTNPVIAVNGSGTADAPFILINLNTTGQSNLSVSYNLRDLDCSADNAAQSVALMFRVGNSGSYTNLATGFVADATSRPIAATDIANCTQVTPVNVALPPAADNQPLVQVRVITTNAGGNDEAVGIDDISITGSIVVLPTNPSGSGSANPSSVVSGNSTLLTVNVTPGANPPSTGLAVTADLSTIGGNNPQTFYDDGSNGDVTPGDNIFSYFATVTLATAPGPKSLPFTITDAQVRSGSGSISLTVQAPPPPSDHVVISQIYGGGGNTLATYKNDYVELYNPSPTTFNLNGWSIQYASAAGNVSSVVPLAGPINSGEYYLIKLGTNGAVGLDVPPANVENTGVNISATNGKIALVNNSVALSGTCPTGDPDLVDYVGYGSANCREGTANAPAGSNTTAVLRKANGAQDTNQNGDDFATGAPNPRRTAIILDSPPTVAAIDTDSDPGASTPAPKDGSVAVFFSEDVEVNGTWYDLTCANTGSHTAVIYAGPKNWIVTPDVNFEPGEQCTFTVLASQVNDADTDDSQPNTDFMQANFVAMFTVATGAPLPYDASVHLAMGNPSGAVNDTGQPNNYLLSKAELALSYNRDRGGPNWVSWHLTDEWDGTLTRVDTFRPDPQLPASWNRVHQFDYTGSGFNRGHMVPSADRRATLPMNQATFLMDNIIPQAPDNNQFTWNNMEQDLRAYTPANELYIISGGAGIGGSGDNGPASTIADGKVTVPAQIWKVALVIPKGENDISRVDCSSRTIAVIVPNTNDTNPDWTTYLTTVDAVEALTGYDFFSNLPEPIQRCVEAGINGNNPPLDTDNDTVPDSSDNCPFVVNTDQANNDGDAQGDACDADDDNDGTLDTDEAACGSDPLNGASTCEVCDGIDNDLNEGVDEGFPNNDNDGLADCVDPDDDNDGVPDGDDNCPFVANADQADADQDGIGNVCDAQTGPPTKDQCKNGGWQFFNYPRTFQNQGDCIQ
ncbi:MAG TPA: DNA/RNA non-specific endonuclease, partial [Pyrinomonadaceae bacterium]